MDYLNMDGAVNGECQGTYEIENPYYNADPNFFIDKFFIPNHYASFNSHFERNITLSYLITHLDGMSLSEVKKMIDSSVAAINSSGYDWFIDSDPTPCHGSGQILYPYDTKNTFDALGITNYFIDNTNTVDTNHVKSVMSYISNGTHTSENPNDNCDLFFQPDYIQTQLHFTYIAGSVFNTAESFNVNTLGTNPPVRREGAEMGQIPEFFHEGGTVGVGQVIHGPGAEGGIINNDAIMLPSYALGYSFIEAAYLGMPHLTATRIVVGDPLTRIAYPCEPTILTANTVISSGDYVDCGFIVPEGITLTINSTQNNPVNFKRNAKIVVYGNLVIEDNADLNILNYGGINIWGKATLGNNSSLEISNHGVVNVEEGGEITFGNYSTIQTSDQSVVDSKGRMTCDLGVQITNGSTFKVANKFFARGTENFPVSINSFIAYNDIDSMSFDHVNFYSASSNFNNINRKGVLSVLNSNFYNSVLSISNLSTLTIQNNNFFGGYTAIGIQESHLTNIQNCTFGDCTYGIVSKSAFQNVNVLDSLTIKNCEFSNVHNPINPPNGIFISNADAEFHYIHIDSTIYNGIKTAISINNFDYCNVNITNSTATDYISFGISLTNGSTGLVQNNIITTSNSAALGPIGIYLSQVSNPLLFDNTLSTTLSSPGSGIVSVSSNGIYKGNEISGYYNGIELGNSSSPNMALNEIHDNHHYGLYISAGSNPILKKAVSNGHNYPLSGFNIIYENGFSGELMDDPEIYINTANVQLSKGCNTIADDRNTAPPYDHKILMDGVSVRFKIQADSNYWGDHPVYGHNPAQRFGSGVNVGYLPYNTVPCTYSPDESNLLVLKTTSGSIADTIYSNGILLGELSATENAYSTANNYFYNGSYSQAENAYKQIISGYEDSTSSIEAYKQLYVIKKYQAANSQDYENLRQYYEGKLSSIEDTSILLAVNNLIDMCTVSKSDYENAIGSFDETAQNNQGTDIALYNQINAYTTALLVDTTGLNKSKLVKYRANDISEYLVNINDLLKSRGSDAENNNNNVIPARFILYQNYPNPFNPTTIIRYAIPKTSKVELKVYDILGREIQTLVKETKNPGYYEVQFNAKSLASGVYFYRLKAIEYIKTGKMLLIK